MPSFLFSLVVVCIVAALVTTSAFSGVIAFLTGVSWLITKIDRRVVSRRELAA